MKIIAGELKFPTDITNLFHLYSTKSQQQSPQGALYGKEPTIIQRKPNNQTNPVSQQLGNSGKEKLTFNRKKPPAVPGSERGSHLLRPVGGDRTKETLLNVH